MKILFAFLAYSYAQFQVEHATLTMSRYVSDALPLILQNSNIYDVNITKIENHGCWCSKLGQDSAHFRGGKSKDNYDSLCKTWFKTRNCMARRDNMCSQVVFDHYQINLKSEVSLRKRSVPSVSLYDNVEQHCGQVMAMDDGNEKDCILNICKVDYVALSQLIEMYDDALVGEAGEECKSQEDSEDDDDSGRGDNDESDEEKYKKECMISETWPYVVLETDDNDHLFRSRFFRKKRNVGGVRGNFRLAKRYSKQK